MLKMPTMIFSIPVNAKKSQQPKSITIWCIFPSRSTILRAFRRHRELRMEFRIFNWLSHSILSPSIKSSMNAPLWDAPPIDQSHLIFIDVCWGFVFDGVSWCIYVEPEQGRQTIEYRAAKSLCYREQFKYDGAPTIHLSVPIKTYMATSAKFVRFSI